MKKLQYGQRNKEKPKIHIIIIILIIIISLLATFLFYILMQNEQEKPAPDISSYFTTIESLTESQSNQAESETSETATESEKLYNPVPESLKKEYTYFDDCVFIGDSISVGLSSYGILPEKNVLASVGNNIDKINTITVKHDGEELHIADAVKKINPKNVYMMLGSNGIAWLTNEHMIKNYTQFIDRIKEAVPDANIYILSIPPVTAEKEKADANVSNSLIDSYNSALLSMSNEYNIYYVDINTALKGNDGKLPSESAAKDGMHFQKNTYYIMLDYILSHTIEDNLYATEEQTTQTSPSDILSSETSNSQDVNITVGVAETQTQTAQESQSIVIID